MNKTIEFIKSFPKFISESIDETKKLTFPTKESILAGTLVVFLVSLILIVYIFVIDFIVSNIVAYIIRLFGG